jgi:hypothetical protein
MDPQPFWQYLGSVTELYPHESLQFLRLKRVKSYPKTSELNLNLVNYESNTVRITMPYDTIHAS